MVRTDKVSEKILQSGMTGESSDFRHWIRIQWLMTLLGAVGIPAIFLPFTWDISPFAAAFETDFNLWRIGWPALLPVLIAIALLRWLISTTISRTELNMAGFVGAGSTVLVCFTISGMITTIGGWPGDLKEWLSIVLPVVTLGFAVFALLKTRQNLMFKPFRAIMSMQIAYIANCLLCLSSFFGEWQIGAYFCLITVIVYLIQMILVFAHWYNAKNNQSNFS
jgi:hypothetical protein